MEICVVILQGQLQRSIKGITTAAVPVHVCDRVKSLPKCAKKKP